MVLSKNHFHILLYICIGKLTSPSKVTNELNYGAMAVVSLKSKVGIMKSDGINERCDHD